MNSISLTFLFISVSGVLSAQAPTVLLNNNHKMPIVGLGAMNINEAAVREAIADGYRHIDTSLQYHGVGQDSELIIGKVLKELITEGKLKREEIFITSKLEGGAYHSRAGPMKGIKESLHRLGLEYLDLYLVHFPENEATLLDTWMGMEDVLKANLTRSIGVSNFNEHQIDLISSNGKNVKPVTNQVLSNPYHTQKKLLAYLNEHKISMTAYSPLGGQHDSGLLKDAKLTEVAHRHNVTVAQIALKYQVQRGVIVIPMSNTPKYIKENIDLFGFTLSEAYITEIESVNKQK